MIRALFVAAIWSVFVDLFVSSVIVRVCVLLSRPIKGLKWHGFLFAFVFLSVICVQARVLLCNCFRFHFVCTALAYACVYELRARVRRSILGSLFSFRSFFLSFCLFGCSSPLPCLLSFPFPSHWGTVNLCHSFIGLGVWFARNSANPLLANTSVLADATAPVLCSGIKIIARHTHKH